MRILRVLSSVLVVFVFGSVVLTRSNLPPADRIEQIRAYTRNLEFDYIEWMLDALGLKNRQAALGVERYLTVAEQRQAVFDYLDLVRRGDDLNYRIALIYADPNQKDPAGAAADLIREQKAVRADLERLAPVAEEIVQSQIAYILAEKGLTLAGQPVPPVMYHITPLPYALIVSPRDKIEQIVNISLKAGLTLDERVAIEDRVAKGQNLSTLVVGIGGVGVYPTMVMSTSDFNWLSETVAHEWTHNFLTLRPLGLNYEPTPELRTINETVASIVGSEVGEAMIRRFYPELAPPAPPSEPAPYPAPSEPPTQPPSPPPFDFRKEMRQTRVTVDALLAEGKIEEAENYMEARRKVFWDNGYLIRKLNQAYFAFYGAYNDQPGGGASGQDPVGPAVQALRSRSASLADFLNRVSWITSFDQLKQMVQ